MRLVMMGPPGAGKGTQAEQFARDNGIPKISTGDMLREAVAAGSELGQAVKAVMDGGGLVGDDLIVSIVKERLAKPDAQTGFVLDGFPRTVRQARALDTVLDGGQPLIVLEIQVPDEELVRRVLLRRICSNCGTLASAFEAQAAVRCLKCGGELIQRSDDTEEVARERLRVYWRETQPMIAYYQERPTYRVIDGAQAPEQVYADLTAAVASAMGRESGVKSA